MSVQTIPLRSEIAVEHTWDAASIFPTDAAWEQEFIALEEALPGLGRFQGHLGDSPDVLAEWLQTSEALLKRMLLVYQYGTMFHSVDTTDQEAVAKNDRVSGLVARALAAVSFTDPELLGIGFAMLRRWLEED